MNIIFIDIDGVFSCTETVAEYYERTGKTDGWQVFRKGAIKSLTYILDNTNAMIVVHSTWAYTKSLGYIQDKFMEYGLSREHYERFIDVAVSDRSHRGNRIQNWLNEHERIERIVILDDSLDVEPYGDFLVFVNGDVGLTQKDAERAVQILNGGLM